MGAVRGGGRAGVRSMRRCGVCLTAVQGRVEAVGLEKTGVLNSSRTLDASVAFSAWDNVCGRWGWFSSALTVSTCESVRFTAQSALDLSPKTACFSATSNSRKPNASFLYLASSAPRLGPETCTRISIGGVIVYLHLEESSLS